MGNEWKKSHAADLRRLADSIDPPARLVIPTQALGLAEAFAKMAEIADGESYCMEVTIWSHKGQEAEVSFRSSIVPNVGPCISEDSKTLASVVEQHAIRKANCEATPVTVEQASELVAAAEAAPF